MPPSKGEGKRCSVLQYILVGTQCSLRLWMVDARVTTHNLYVYQIVLVSIVKVYLLSPEMDVDIQTLCEIPCE